MKARTQRTHFTGFSNRNPSNPGRTTTSDMYEKSFMKSRSHYYPPSDKINNTTAHFNYCTTKSMNEPKSSSQLNINSIYHEAQKGHHYEFESKRWTNEHNNSKNLQSFYQDRINLAPLPLTFNNKLNSHLSSIKTAFQNKEVNLHKLSELKRTFLLNNQKRRNLKSLFSQFANDQGVVDKIGFRKLIKTYGYDVNESEADLVFKLNQVHDKDNNASDNSQVSSLDLPQFVNLMTKENVYFKTLKLNSNNIPSNTQSYKFSPADFQIFRNKFSKLKEAFNIYKNQPIDKQKFDKVMKKLDINDLVIKENKRHEIFENFAKQNGSLNVEQLLGVIAAQEHERVSKSGNQLKVTNHDSFQQNIQANEEYNFDKHDKKDPLLDVLYPVNLKKAQFVDFQRRLKSAQQICQKLKQLNQSSHRNIISQLCSSNSTISKNDLYKKVETLLQSQGYNFSKNQYKSFLSFIDFDSKNNISSQKLQNIVLNETERQRVNRLDRRVRNDERRENQEEGVEKSKVKEDEFVEKFRSKSSINWSSVKKNAIKQDNLPEFKVPTKFSAWPQRLYNADFTLLQAKSSFGMGITQPQRFQKDQKHTFGQQDRLRKLKIYENKVRKIAQWSETNQRRVQEKGYVEENKQMAKQYNLRLMKEQYQQRCAANVGSD